MKTLLNQLQLDFPALSFVADKQFYWSPETREIHYDNQASDKQAAWSLLHETGHALLDHTTYEADFGLVRMEVAAWDKARELAVDYDYEIDEDHIQDCLDTYRDWLYKRSICPNCTTKCLQRSSLEYHCFNCHTAWHVSASRFCRAYRSHRSVKEQAIVFTLKAQTN